MKKKIIPKVLCVIPAKKSSRRLKKKNKKIINGHPMIAWTIHEAKKTKKISDLIVSTDCEKIMKISREYGASTPFKRPSSLSKSNIDNYAVIESDYIHTVTHLYILLTISISFFGKVRR